MASASSNASAPVVLVAPSATLTPTTVQQVVRLSRYQFRDYLRSRRFLLMTGLVGVIGLIITAILGYFRPAGLIDDPLAFWGSLWGGGAIFVMVMAAVIYGGDAIAGEFQNKTGYFLMGLPMRRSTVYVAKYIAAFMASLAALVLYLVILALNAAYYLGGGFLPWQLGESFVLSVVYLLAVIGAALMFSSLFKTSMYATLLVLVLFLFGFQLLQDLISGLVKVEPWFVISYASPVIGDVFSNPYPPHVETFMAGPRQTITMYNPTVAEGVAVMIGYFLSTSVAGLLLFEREEFT